VNGQASSLPKQTWRILGLTAVLLLVAAVTGIGFISAGMFDPKPVGELTAELPLQPITIPSKTEQLTWLDYDLPSGSFTVRLTAAYQSGSLDSAYGLALGSQEQALLIALSPTGYAAIQTFTPPAAEGELDNMIANHPLNGTLSNSLVPILEWQPWPHINTGTGPNEIWLDQRGNTITIRINRELFWTDSFPIQFVKAGLWLTSYDEPVTITFETFFLFSD
jgi:hypothetical protein